MCGIQNNYVISKVNYDKISKITSHLFDLGNVVVMMAMVLVFMGQRMVVVRRL